MTVRAILFIYFAVIVCSNTINGQGDSTVLSYNEFIQNIVNFHPLSQKANLRTLAGNAELLQARGNFDPVINSDWDQKNFDDKLYFQRYQTKLRIPTPLGIDVVTGYENTQGVFLNPESNTDIFGLWNLGIEVDVLQGLFVNERRTALNQARIFQNIAENEKQILINDLFYGASGAYLLWQQYFFFQDVLNENINIAQTYFGNTKQSFFNGEKTALDTLEAYILLQDAISLEQKNEIALIKSRQNLENFLWYDESPVALQPTTIPEDVDSDFLQVVLAEENPDISNNPTILSYINKLSYFEIEQRLKREKLKPKLKVKYNPLLGTSNENLVPIYSVLDYKWGFNFSMPLLLRSERANIQKGEIKIREIELDLYNKRNELQNKIQGSWLQYNMLQEQIDLLSRNVESYRQLFEGETTKFNFGESSVFLLNKRQEKYINGQLKLIEAKIKMQLELLNFLYYSNQIINILDLN